jgi:hypothetical protein
VHIYTYWVCFTGANDVAERNTVAAIKSVLMPGCFLLPATLEKIIYENKFS